MASYRTLSFPALFALEKYKSLSSQPTNDQPEIYSQLKSILSVGQKEYKARFLCKLGNKIKSIPVENIQYFYSESKLTFIVDNKNNSVNRCWMFK